MYEVGFQGMGTFLEPGFQSTTVVYDGRIFTVGEDTVPLAEMYLPLVGGLEPVFHEVVFEIEVQHLATQSLVGSILIGEEAGICMLFQIGDHLLSDIVLPPVVEVDEQDTGIEIGCGNLVTVVYEDVIAPLVFHHPTGITVKGRVPQLGKVMAYDDITVEIDHL